MRNTVIELFWVAVGLTVTAAITSAAAWAYPIGRNVIQWVGIAAGIAVVAIHAGSLSDAWASDHDAKD